MLANLADEPWTCEDVPGEVLLAWEPDVVVAGSVDVPARSAVLMRISVDHAAARSAADWAW